MKNLKPLYPLILSIILTLASSSLAQTLTVLTHDSFAISEDIIAGFTTETGIDIEFIAGGDAGETLNRAILTKNNPLADLLYGVDNSLYARAVNEGVFEAYKSPALDNINPRYAFDKENFVTPIDAGYINFNLDKAYFAEQGLNQPTDITDLTSESYTGLSVLENPTTSSPGLAFMLATIARFGDTGSYTWLNYWADLRDNDVEIVSGWSDAYYASFTLYGGEKPIVLSYASSPAAEVMFAETPLDEAPTANLFCQSCVFEQIEAVGILKGSKNLEAAQTFIDFMLSNSFQAGIAPNMFVYPVVTETQLPKEFALYGQIPTAEQSATLEPLLIEANLKTWLNQWTQVVEQGRDPANVE